MAILTTSYQMLGQQHLGTDQWGGKLYIRVYAKYSDQEIANNRTKVQYQARAYFDKNWNIYDRQSNGTIGGTSATTTSFTKSTDYNGGEEVLGTTEAWVPHDNEGKKSITASTYLSLPNYGWSGTASGTADLPTIPRASEISSVSTANIGSNATITVNRKSSSYTHTITYSFGNLSGTVVTKSSNTSISWTIPNSFYTKIPDSKTGNGTLTITTYSGNTQIGSSSTKSFSVTTSESACKPTVTGSVIDSNSTTTAITGNNKILIAGYSTANVSYSAAPKNSASIKTITVNNLSAYSGTSSSAVSGTKVISNFNSSTVNIVANDSRTYPATRTLNAGSDYTLVNYIPLTFSGSVSRQTPTGDVLLLSFSGKFFNGNLGATANTLTISWKWRIKGTSTWTNGGTLVKDTDYTINTSNNTYSGSNINLGNSFNYQTNYEIGIFYNDTLVNTSVVLEGKKGTPIVNWGEDYFNVNGKITKNGVQVENGIELYFTNFDAFKSWTVNTGSAGSYLVNLNINGAVSCAIVEKANNNYLSFIWYSYSTNAKQYKYYNGTWTEVELEKYYDEYSTSEIKTNKTWINGKPIYRKVITTTQEVINDTTISHGISNADLIYIEKAFIYGSTGLCWDIPIDLYGTGGTNVTDRLNLYVDRNVIGFKCDTSWNNGWTKVIILEYTKTTD